MTRFFDDSDINLEKTLKGLRVIYNNLTLCDLFMNVTVFGKDNYTYKTKENSLEV